MQTIPNKNKANSTMCIEYKKNWKLLCWLTLQCKHTGMFRPNQKPQVRETCCLDATPHESHESGRLPRSALIWPQLSVQASVICARRWGTGPAQLSAKVSKGS
eukprot:6481550-Amphidinium_carterae.2